jgi:predicted CXXCH cytochrome family protein
MWGCERMMPVLFDVPSADVHSMDERMNVSPAHAAKRESLFVHQPVADRRCAVCHDVDHRMHVRKDYLAACQDCHARYFSDEVGHPPVERSRCNKCHEPHRSTVQGLLVEELFDTCMRCHDDPKDMSERFHHPVNEHVKQCTLCHDPHFGEGFRIRSGAPVGDWGDKRHKAGRREGDL